VKLRAPRTLTQSISGWLYQLVPPLDGVWFGSRHRGLILMWAIFEQPHEDDTGSDTLATRVSVDLTEDTADLVEAFRVLALPATAARATGCWKPLADLRVCVASAAPCGV
jgi:hypothetical protein